MIPIFNKFGTLPPGIHEATLDEIESRFVTNYKRKDLYEHLLILIDDLKKIGCRIIYIDGSFITKKILPHDVDICWESKGVNLNNAKINMPELWDMNFPRIKQQNKYHADIFPSDFYESSTSLYFLDFFQVDKNTGYKKGIIKLKI